jgi:two-component system response regulator
MGATMNPKEFTVMCIEDNDDHVELVRTAITQSMRSCRFIRFVDAESALEYIFQDCVFNDLKHGLSFDLILLDLALPGMNGLTFLKRLKSYDHTKRIPVIVLTISGDEEQIAEAYHLGANSYVVKPLHEEEFIIKLVELSMYWSLTAEVPNPIGAAAASG